MDRGASIEGRLIVDPVSLARLLDRSKPLPAALVMSIERLRQRAVDSNSQISAFQSSI